MKGPRRLALLSAVALAGCVSTRDEPFPLDDGDAVSPAAGRYVCDSYDPEGKTVEGAHHGRLISLRRNKKSQYVFADDETSSVEPFTLHKAGGDLYVVAVAHAEAPGEDLYVAQFTDAGKEFKLYVEGDDFDARAQGVAQRNGVTLARNQFSNDLSGPVDGQKAFMIDMASDPKGWRMSAECRAERRELLPPSRGKEARIRIRNLPAPLRRAVPTQSPRSGRSAAEQPRSGLTAAGRRGRLELGIYGSLTVIESLPQNFNVSTSAGLSLALSHFPPLLRNATRTDRHRS